MEPIEICWKAASCITELASLTVEGWMFCCFIRPFLYKKKYAGAVGLVYSIVMLFLYLIPPELTYPRIFGAAAAFFAMCLADRKNIRQKAVLVITMYLLRWIAAGISLLPGNICFALFINTPYMTERPVLQFVVYCLLELFTCFIEGLFLYLLVLELHRVYVDKRENVSGKELLLLLSILFAVFMGYFAFTFFSRVYENDTGQYIWNVHRGYNILRILYQCISCMAIFITIVAYQRMKEKQKEEMGNVVLAEQMENMKKHICEVEKLYSDIRSLKHDMGNHITVMENLFLKNDKAELETYFSELKARWKASTAEMKTGNPVTDVILMQMQAEAFEKGIDFRCGFYYPAETKVEVFDVSIILNNALTNAIKAAEGCQNPYVSVSSYRRKHVYMIEVQNCTREKVEINGETGLPETTKCDKEHHGYGLVSICKIAQKYYGDIDIEQMEGNFRLSIMLMAE